MGTKSYLLRISFTVCLRQKENPRIKLLSYWQSILVGKLVMVLIISLSYSIVLSPAPITQAGIDFRVS